MMNYEQFRSLSPFVIGHFSTLLTIKIHYQLELTGFEKQLHQHFITFNNEVTVIGQKHYLEACLTN
jgi:hypothetical protein